MKIKIIFLFLTLAIQIKSQNYSTVDQIKDYLIKNINNLEAIEGIWSVSIKWGESLKVNGAKDINDRNREAIIKQGGILCTYKIENDNKRVTKVDGLSYLNTSSEKIYIQKTVLESSKILTYYANFVSDNVFKVETTADELIMCTEFYLKIFPDDNTVQEALKKEEKRAGTGFAISNNGYFVTCNHVIENAKSIKVKGVNGDFNNSYNAKIIITDINNDIAILKIDDIKLIINGTIPYTIKSTVTEVGTNIYILGYPLTATMGDEIKLTNGIVSAKSGFMGDITSYQITAAVQPGNSGGPLFDDFGRIIGIVNAKHYGAENASYAIKSAYLINLIESLPAKLALPTINALSGKDLTNKVKIMKNFIYIIEVN